jgi:hypothetical protein
MLFDLRLHYLDGFSIWRQRYDYCFAMINPDASVMSHQNLLFLRDAILDGVHQSRSGTSRIAFASECAWSHAASTRAKEEVLALIAMAVVSIILTLLTHRISVSAAVLPATRSNALHIVELLEYDHQLTRKYGV